MNLGSKIFLGMESQLLRRADARGTADIIYCIMMHSMSLFCGSGRVIEVTHKH